jgi:hypothetical protein
MEWTGLAPGMTATGENAQLRLLGNPEHVRDTALLKEPAWGVTVRSMLPPLPALIVIADGLAATVMLPL